MIGSDGLDVKADRGFSSRVVPRVGARLGQLLRIHPDSLAPSLVPECSFVVPFPLWRIASRRPQGELPDLLRVPHWSEGIDERWASIDLRACLEKSGEEMAGQVCPIQAW